MWMGAGYYETALCDLPVCLLVSVRVAFYVCVCLWLCWDGGSWCCACGLVPVSMVGQLDVRVCFVLVLVPIFMGL